MRKQNERIQMKAFNELKESLLTEKKVKVGDQFEGWRVFAIDKEISVGS